MSNTSQIPMLDAKGNPGMVDADKVEAATASGFTPAAKMVGPKGEIGYVAQDKVSAARQSNYAVTPDSPGVTRMADPETGKFNYVLPNEVDQFKAMGHVPIEDSGNFRVDPVPGEDNTDTMARAAKLAKNLPPEAIKKAIAAEAKTITPKRVAASLVAGPAIATTQLSGMAALETLGGAGITQAAKLFAPKVIPVAAGAGFGGAAASETLGPSIAAVAAKEAGKYVVKHALSIGAGGLGTILGLKWLGKL